ncbi:MAG: DUF1735 domain-containing protein [Bacteroidia bacterium]|nr:DUF1735 domain-containing protein [Bacteroidia bacterium]
MLKKIFINFAFVVIILSTFSACDPYEEYVKDYTYSAVYFGTQKPLRTLVTRENSDTTLNFKLGVTLAGLRENKTDQWVTFEIAPDLLTTITGASVYTLLPADWYSFSISENTITIPKGKFMGDFTISINKAKFTADPLSLTKKYALPVRILTSSADSILRGNATILRKDYTILVVKYISENAGTYFVRGIQTEYNTTTLDTIAGTTKKYYSNDWSKNKTRSFTTLSPDSTDMTGLGSDASADKMKIKFAANKAVTLGNSTSSPTITIVDMGSSYDATTGEFHLIYTYLKTGKTYKVDEYLKQRNDPEKDLRFEEW